MTGLLVVQEAANIDLIGRSCRLEGRAPELLFNFRASELDIRFPGIR